MKIIYTKHALRKFKDLAELGIVVTKRLINATVNNPLNIDTASDYPKIIATGRLNESHIVRIVFRKEDDTIIVITFYPARKERYL